MKTTYNLAKVKNRYGELSASFLIAGLWSSYLCLSLAVLFLLPTSARAHGFAGKRFFPSTFQVEDPFVSDELSLLYGYIKEPGEEELPAADVSELSLEYSKRITPHFGLSIGTEYVHLNFDDAYSESGFNNGVRRAYESNNRSVRVLSGVNIK